MRHRIWIPAYATLLVASSVSAQTPVSMKNVEMEAVFRPETRVIEAVLRVAVATPIGKIPVTGHGILHYMCDGTFHGTMSYNPIVRFFARLKGVALVTALDGRLASTEPFDCSPTRVRILTGRANVDSTLMSGWVKIDSDSVPFRGPAWTFGDSTYHSVIGATLANRQTELHINMYKHPRMMRRARK